MSLSRSLGVGLGVRSRDRQEIKKMLQEEQELERKRKDAELAPLRVVEEQLAETNQALFRQLKESVLTVPVDTFDETALQNVPRLRDGETRTPEAVRDAFTEFKSTESSFKPSQEGFNALTDFMDRNSLDPESPLSWAAAFRILTYVGAMPEPQPEPEPEPETPALNPPVELDPAEEAWKRLERYENEIVCTFDNVGYSQKALDNLPSDLYAKITRLARTNQYFPQPRH